MTRASAQSGAESHYRDMLASQTGGRIEVPLPFGRCDVMTDTTVYEVEPISSWRHGAAQALQYAAQVSQRGALALYGKPFALPEVYSRLTALPPPGLELWWFADSEFIRVKSLAHANSLIPAPEPEPPQALQRKPLLPNALRPKPLRESPRPETPVTTRVAAKAIGVGISSLQRWAAKGLVIPAWRTSGGQARWDVDDLKAQLRMPGSPSREPGNPA